MKTAIGMITRNIDTDGALARFLDNAEKYGHKIDCVIAAYSHEISKDDAAEINKRAPLYAIDIHNPKYCIDEFERRGIDEKSKNTLLQCPVRQGSWLVPYGFNRNLVVMEAILRGIDVLIFVDSDIIPAVLKRDENGFTIAEADLFGGHLEFINSGSQITTSEYSGYNILPPASFEGMDELLAGLQKDAQLEYWQDSESHRCLLTQDDSKRGTPCTKILGGNTAIKLSAYSKLPPFFSSFYIAGDELFLARGEDTLLGPAIERSGTVSTDIGLHPLHDTYRNYPEEPDLQRDRTVQERFYYACTGWVGRNPLMNYFLANDLKEAREFQRECLETGLYALAEYTSNPRFLSVMDNFNVSWDNLSRYIGEFERVMDAWCQFVKRSDLQ